MPHLRKRETRLSPSLLSCYGNCRLWGKERRLLHEATNVLLPYTFSFSFFSLATASAHLTSAPHSRTVLGDIVRGPNLGLRIKERALACGHLLALIQTSRTVVFFVSFFSFLPSVKLLSSFGITAFFFLVRVLLLSSRPLIPPSFLPFLFVSCRVLFSVVLDQV